MKHFSQWDEFQWENEIKRHEESVANYFRDLVYCLDLPVGDLPESAAGTAGAPSDPVTARQADAMKKWQIDHEEQEDAVQEYEPRRPVCFSCVDSLDQLAVKWNLLTLEHCVENDFAFALGINCAFAKLLARTADFTEPDKECSPSLLLSLGKRAVFDLEDLVSRLNNYTVISTGTEDYIAYFNLRLALLRDQLISKINEIRQLL